MDRSTLALSGCVVGLVALGLILVVTRPTPPPPDLATPSGTMLAYALAEQRGDGQTAWNLLASDVKQHSDRGQFLGLTSTERSGFEFFATDHEVQNGDSASVVLVRTYRSPSFGLFTTSETSTSRTAVQLGRESGAWRISVPPDEYDLRRIS